MYRGDKRKKYIKEFRHDAIRFLGSGTEPGLDTEHDLGIGSGQIYRWRKHFSQEGAGAFPGNRKYSMTRNWPALTPDDYPEQ